MKSTTIYLDEEQHKELHSLSKQSGLPMAVMIRKGVDLALDWYQEWLEDRVDDGQNRD